MSYTQSAYPTPTKLYIGSNMLATSIATPNPSIRINIGSINCDILSIVLSDSDL